ncbi:hypothetical protein F0562_016124 [Nyssa sinensis]|uniref:Pentatricopeptide repeat-containing protein n=1 Tax=Nyssa sinensis TaxID=561372 RepID=A0A5J4ZIY7_9ASTE|nr:hypothetical protein F0562_016124 [Nyssa sinensis]
MALHATIIKLEEDTYLSNALISAYLKLGLATNAHRVFAGLSCPDVVSYTAMISGFAKLNREYEAVKFFFKMRSSGIEPNEYSFVAMLTACIRLSELELGFQLHALAIKIGCSKCTFVSNAIMGLYVKHGCLDLVLELFDEMSQRDIVSWNTVIAGVVKELMYERAFELFRDMQRIDGFRVDQFTLSTLLAASTRDSAFIQGREIHAHALKTGFEVNLSVINALIVFYTKCGSVKDVVALFVRHAFKGYVKLSKQVHGFILKFGFGSNDCIEAALLDMCTSQMKAISLFCLMQSEETMVVDEVALAAVLGVCGTLGFHALGEQLHGPALKTGFLSDTGVGNAIVSMYSKCGNIEDAIKVFNIMPTHDIVSWNGLMAGHLLHRQGDEALACVVEDGKGWCTAGFSYLSLNYFSL